jgi:hypothetical protein
MLQGPMADRHESYKIADAADDTMAPSYRPEP